MATSPERPGDMIEATQVGDMPPMTVTTAGIPTSEHLDASPPVTDREQRTRWFALAFSGVLALLAVFVLIGGAIVAAPEPSTSTVIPGYGQYGSTLSEWPPRATPIVIGWLPEASPVMSEWPPRTTPSRDGYAQWGATVSEWPPRTTPSTDGYAQWGATTSEWPPRA